MVEIDCHLSQANNFVEIRVNKGNKVHHFPQSSSQSPHKTSYGGWVSSITATEQTQTDNIKTLLQLNIFYTLSRLGIKQREEFINCKIVIPDFWTNCSSESDLFDESFDWFNKPALDD